MLKSWLSWINIGIGACILLFSSLGAVYYFSRPSVIPLADVDLNKRILPKNSFQPSKESCASLGKHCLELQFAPLNLQLPDLRNHLIYYGKNGRPDAKADRTVLHFAFTGNTTISSLSPGDRLYLYYDKSKSQYLFSPEHPTALWIEATAQGNEAIVNVRMKNEEGQTIAEPASYAQFRLPEKEGNMRLAGKNWEIGKYRVDGSLLARQKGSWKGVDRFLERHGGPEYAALQNKHRIDFTDDDRTYSVYVGLNDSLIWDQDHWKVAQPGDNTLAYPLMVVKKVDERLMSFELWEVGGKGKIPLNLVKSGEPWAPATLQTVFQCLGARTRSQYIFEIAGQRFLLSPQDWLIQTDEGWVKLNTPEEIDDYVERRKIGLLFIFDGVARKEGRQLLTGVVFNASRTEMHEIEIPVQKSGSNSQSKTKAEEDDDDDDLDDDDDDDSSA